MNKRWAERFVKNLRAMQLVDLQFAEIEVVEDNDWEVHVRVTIDPDLKKVNRHRQFDLYDTYFESLVGHLPYPTPKEENSNA